MGLASTIKFLLKIVSACLPQKQAPPVWSAFVLLCHGLQPLRKKANFISVKERKRF